MNIINDTNIVNFIFLPSKFSPIQILKSLGYSKIKFNSLIDTGYLINNISPKKVAYYILQFLDYIDCCIYIDNGKHMCMLPMEKRRLKKRRRKIKRNKNGKNIQKMECDNEEMIINPAVIIIFVIVCIVFFHKRRIY